MDKLSYPIRIVTGVARHVKNGLLIGEVRLDQCAVDVLLQCEGDRTTEEILRVMANSRCHRHDRKKAECFLETLLWLEGNSFVTFSMFESTSRRVVRVRFEGFWTFFNKEHNYFTKMLRKWMLVIVQDSGVPDVFFVSDCSSTLESLQEITKINCQKVFVSSGKVMPDLEAYDYVISSNAVEEQYSANHTHLSLERYMRTKPFLVHQSLAYRFHEFLIPVNFEDFRFEFSEPALSAAKVREDGIYHVFLCCDSRQKQGLFALINSIVVNSRSPEKFFFHILVDKAPDLYTIFLKKQFEGLLKYEVLSFESTGNYQRNYDFLTTNIRVEHPKRVKSVMNFARFYLPEIFPHVDFGLYLDVDMIV